MAKQLQQLRGRQQMALDNYENAFRMRENLGANWDINSVANDLQSLELLTGNGESVEQLQVAVNEDEEPSISYRLPGQVNLASRSDQQMVRILQTALDSRFYHVATPVLTSNVYREAEMTNTSQEDLLGGPINVYLDGRFVGRGEIATVARGQTFLVGFGADAQLRARRELADKAEKTLGGNREMAFDYRLVIENYKDAAVAVRVFDRLPYSDHSGAVRVTLGEMAAELSKDPVYLRIERPKGILRWEAEVAASAAGEKAHMIEYGYTLEYDRTAFLATPAGASLEQQQRDFEKLQQQRNRR